MKGDLKLDASTSLSIRAASLSIRLASLIIQHQVDVEIAIPRY
jgi:hypothetical protein